MTLFDDGLEVRKRVVGAEYVERALANANDFDSDFQRIVTEYCWGEVWTQPVLISTSSDHLTISVFCQRSIARRNSSSISRARCATAARPTRSRRR